MNNYRHGDLALIGISQLEKDLKESKDNILIQSSGGNAHSFRNGKFYPKTTGNNIIGYFEAKKNCVLLHKEHGKEIKGKELRESKIAQGFYEVRRQVEVTHEGMRQVQD